jgi:hypothetical protein
MTRFIPRRMGKIQTQPDLCWRQRLTSDPPRKYLCNSYWVRHLHRGQETESTEAVWQREEENRPDQARIGVEGNQRDARWEGEGVGARLTAEQALKKNLPKKPACKGTSVHILTLSLLLSPINSYSLLSTPTLSYQLLLHPVHMYIHSYPCTNTNSRRLSSPKVDDLYLQ